jgi:hypothetical protein
MNSPNHAPLNAPAPAARAVVSRPVTRSTRRTPCPDNLDLVNREAGVREGVDGPLGLDVRRIAGDAFPAGLTEGGVVHGLHAGPPSERLTDILELPTSSSVLAPRDRVRLAGVNCDETWLTTAVTSGQLGEGFPRGDGRLRTAEISQAAGGDEAVRRP